MRTPRALLLLLGCAALLVAVVQGVTGADQLALSATPFLVLLGLLLSGKFIGEEAILARQRARAPVAARPIKRKWDLVREQALTSLLERRVQLLRGPPAGLLAA